MEKFMDYLCTPFSEDKHNNLIHDLWHRAHLSLSSSLSLLPPLPQKSVGILELLGFQGIEIIVS